MHNLKGESLDSAAPWGVFTQLAAEPALAFTAVMLAGLFQVLFGAKLYHCPLAAQGCRGLLTHTTIPNIHTAICIAHTR